MAVSVRRYYLGKRQQAREDGDTALEALWQGKQESEPVQVAAVLADDFPFKDKLAAGFYVSDLDLDGATLNELTQTTALTAAEAAAVLKAAAALEN